MPDIVQYSNLTVLFLTGRHHGSLIARLYLQPKSVNLLMKDESDDSNSLNACDICQESFESWLSERRLLHIKSCSERAVRSLFHFYSKGSWVTTLPRMFKDSHLGGNGFFLVIIFRLVFVI